MMKKQAVSGGKKENYYLSLNLNPSYSQAFKQI